MNCEEARMENSASFIVDWPVAGEVSRITPYVNLRTQGRSVGLYQVKQCATHRMVVVQSKPPLPVGAQFEVRDVQGLLPNLPTLLLARVVASDPMNVSLAW
jgi:hypothetical protein